jgi:hypothetical protein
MSKINFVTTIPTASVGSPVDSSSIWVVVNTAASVGASDHDVIKNILVSNSTGTDLFDLATLIDRKAAASVDATIMALYGASKVIDLVDLDELKALDTLLDDTIVRVDNPTVGTITDTRVAEGPSLYFVQGQVPIHIHLVGGQNVDTAPGTVRLLSTRRLVIRESDLPASVVTQAGAL